MTTDPGELVLDPTCGSGTSAYAAEKWGRRWLTCNTSRVALALTRQRMMTEKFPYYKLANPRQGAGIGFAYETVPYVTLRSSAQNEPSSSEVLYDRPLPESDKVRASGRFTVEAIPIATAVEDSRKPSTGTGVGPMFGTQPGVPGIEASDYVGTLIRILSKDGVTYPKGRNYPSKH